jgi:hydrogenase nickel incorporation protein HypA/HybF
MHEYSLAQSLVRQVIELQQREHATRVNAVYVRVGEFAGVDAELLRSAAESLASEMPDLASARIVLETVPLRARCSSCEREFPVENFRFACPHCGGRQVTIVHGEELQLERIELETEVP